MLRFASGNVYATPGSLDALEASGETAIKYLRRHMSGDWGEVDDEDKQENEYSIENDLRILSAYTIGNGTKIWVITEADRSATTLLLPSEY